MRWTLIVTGALTLTVLIPTVPAPPVWDFTITYELDDATGVLLYTGSLAYTHAIVCTSGWNLIYSEAGPTPDTRHLIKYRASYTFGELQTVEQADGSMQTDLYRCSTFTLDGGPVQAPTSSWVKQEYPEHMNGCLTSDDDSPEISEEAPLVVQKTVPYPVPIPRGTTGLCVEAMFQGMIPDSDYNNKYPYCYPCIPYSGPPPKATVRFTDESIPPPQVSHLSGYAATFGSWIIGGYPWAAGRHTGGTFHGCNEAGGCDGTLTVEVQYSSPSAGTYAGIGHFKR